LPISEHASPLNARGAEWQQNVYVGPDRFNIWLLLATKLTYCTRIALSLPEIVGWIDVIIMCQQVRLYMCAKNFIAACGGILPTSVLSKYGAGLIHANFLDVKAIGGSPGIKRQKTKTAPLYRPFRNFWSRRPSINVTNRFLLLTIYYLEELHCCRRPYYCQDMRKIEKITFLFTHASP